MTKHTIARSKQLAGFRYVLIVGQYAADKFYVDLNEAETEMMKYHPGTACVKLIAEYVRGDSCVVK